MTGLDADHENRTVSNIITRAIDYLSERYLSRIQRQLAAGRFRAPGLATAGWMTEGGLHP